MGGFFPAAKKKNLLPLLLEEVRPSRHPARNTHPAAAATTTTSNGSCSGRQGAVAINLRHPSDTTTVIHPAKSNLSHNFERSHAADASKSDLLSSAGLSTAVPSTVSESFRVSVRPNALKTPEYDRVRASDRSSDASPSSKSHLSPRVQSGTAKPFNQALVSEILSRKDWFLTLNSEFKTNVGTLNSQTIVSFLQNVESPYSALKFYLWACNWDQRLTHDKSFRRVLADVLWRKGPVALSVHFLTEINSSGCRITEEGLCILISSWGRLGLANYVTEIFGQIASLGFRPTTRIYNSVIEALVRTGCLDLAYLKFQQMPSDRCTPDSFTYNALIHGVCKLGIVEEALRLLKQMENSGHPPNVYTYTILVDGFCNAKKVQEAFDILEIMRKKNIIPNEATFRSLVYGAFRCLEPVKAYEMLSRIFERDKNRHAHVYNTMVQCLSKNGMVSEAKEFMKRMSQRGYHPDTFTFSAFMVSALNNCLDLPGLCVLFNDFISRGSTPGFNTYLAFIKALLKKGLHTDANKYLKQMVMDGLVSSVVSYNMLIDCFVKSEMMDSAMDLCKEMNTKGFSPNLTTYNTLIGGFSKVGNLDMARTILKTLLEHGFRPDVVTFSSLIDGLCRAHQIDDAFDCFNEMVKWGVPPNVITYNILIRALCTVGDVFKSMKLMKRMKAEGIHPDVFSFNSLIISFCKMNKIDRAQNLFNSMLRFGVAPDNITYNTFIKALCDAQKIEEAKETLHLMELNGCTTNSYSYSPIVDGFISVGNPTAAQELINKCKRRGIHLDYVSDLCTI